MKFTIWHFSLGIVMLIHNSFSWVITISCCWGCLSLQVVAHFTPWLSVSPHRHSYLEFYCFLPCRTFVLDVNCPQIGILYYEFFIWFRKTRLKILATIQRKVVLCPRHSRDLPLLCYPSSSSSCITLGLCFFLWNTFLSPLVE